MSTILPQCPEIEEQVIGNIVHASETIPKLRACGINRKHFINPLHAQLWDFVSARHEKGEPSNLLEIASNMDLASMGGEGVLANLTRRAPIYGEKELERLAEQLREKAALRFLITRAGDVVDQAFRDQDPESVALALAQVAEEAQQEITGRQRSRPIKALLGEFLSEWDARRQGITIARHETGLFELDLALGGGIPKAGLTVCAGETGKGKTALALHLAANAAKRGERILFVSLEMTDFEIIERMVANVGRIPMSDVSTPGEASHGRLEGIKGAISSLAKADAWFSDVMVTGLQDILDECRLLHSQKPLDLILVDYIQLVSGHQNQGMNREREVASVSRALHLTGLQTGAAVVAMSQLNDDGYMRESRAIAQDAKCILAVKDTGIDISKNRQGPGRGTTVPLTLNGMFQRFETARYD